MAEQVTQVYILEFLSISHGSKVNRMILPHVMRCNLQLNPISTVSNEMYNCFITQHKMKWIWNLPFQSRIYLPLAVSLHYRQSYFAFFIYCKLRYKTMYLLFLIIFFLLYLFITCMLKNNSFQSWLEYFNLLCHVPGDNYKIWWTNIEIRVVKIW